MKKFLLIFILIYSASVNASVFGVDDRALIKPFSPEEPYSQAIAVGVLNSMVTEKNGEFNLDVSNTKDFLCAGENFFNEPSIDYACTAFLVGPDLLATAGHCVVNTGVIENDPERYCEVYYWIFDYQSNALGETQIKNIPSENVYKCKKIIFGANQERLPFRDFALIQLDREVIGRNPLKLSNTDDLLGPFSMMGHPLGVPQVLSRGANLIENDLTKQSFVTSLDALEGNSGSPVFNASMEVIGILISGSPEPHLVKDESKDCYRYNMCDESGKNCTNKSTDAGGSDVQRIKPLLDKLESLNPPLIM